MGYSARYEGRKHPTILSAARLRWDTSADAGYAVWGLEACPPGSGVMRIVIFLSLLSGLFIAEACYQRYLQRKREFLASLETLRASLGELTIAYTSFTRVTDESTAAVRRFAKRTRGGRHD